MMAFDYLSIDGRKARSFKREVNNVKRNAIKLLCAAALTACAVGAQAGITEFKNDVNAAIDAGIQYSRVNNHFTTYTAANGLSLLTLLEKESIPAGYNGLDASDKTLAESAACILITNGNFGARGSFYSYYDGQVMMGLSVYLDTGGPDKPAACAASIGARATIDKVVDRTLANQSTGVPAAGSTAGFWNYTSPGGDSSTTQLTLAGLSSAKGFYSAKGESLDKARIGLISTALNLTSAGYAANGKLQAADAQFTNCGAGGCYGHGYQVNGYPPSSQQTASGTWGQLVGASKNVNDANIQRYLRWLQNIYNYNTNYVNQGWPPAYFYYLWSSSKAYNIIQNAGVAALPGNIDPAALGTLPAVGGRLINRDPAADTRPAPRGVGAAGYYGGSPQGWYYDYAYRLMSLQGGTGLFSNPNGSWNSQVDHAYAILVLQRSLGGACVDTDGDGVCDSVDNCPAVPNPGQENTYGDVRGDACEPRPIVATCDLDADGDVDRLDIAVIMGLRNTPASANPKADADGNGTININDVRACTLKCTRPSCATQ